MTYLAILLLALLIRAQVLAWYWKGESRFWSNCYNNAMKRHYDERYYQSYKSFDSVAKAEGEL